MIKSNKETKKNNKISWKSCFSFFNDHKSKPKESNKSPELCSFHWNPNHARPQKNKHHFSEPFFNQHPNRIHFMTCFFFSYSLFSTNADKIYYIRSQKKNAQLIYHGYIYNKKQTQANGQTTWRCSEMSKHRCRAVCITLNSSLVSVRRGHQHQPHWERFTNRELYTTEQDIDAPTDYLLQ